ncbi:potassium channel family protein [Brevibacillus ginsengisoli]|uniref:potassium channel family protein n=1 Tax=Brevibacillus ginsengisoli TaxID=363854 RepID=UPI003CF074D5
MSVSRKVSLPLTGLIIIFLGGAYGFHLLDHISYFDAVWMLMISLLTIGYGDVVPQSFEAKVLGMFVIPIGVGLLTYTLGAIVAGVIEGSFSKTLWRKKMNRSIAKLENHIIVCGLGRVGQQVISELKKENIPIVVIDRDVSQLEEIDKELLFIEGDATEDKILIEAGIERALGLVATLPQDADNVFISLTAKGMQPNIHIVARAERPETEEKLHRAGADKVINPSSIGGRRMAMSILKPISVDFVDTILHAEQEDYSVEEIVLQASSRMTNQTLRENKVRELFGVTVVAIKRGDSIISNPPADEFLRANDLLIVFGTKRQLTQFESAMKK